MHHLKALLLASLVLTSNLTLAAQWTAIGLFDIGTFYVDTDNITHAGDNNKAWTMLDYREPKVHAPTGKNFKSTRMQMEFNCKEQTVRTLSLSYHTGVRLSGDALSTEGVIGPFEPVPPETPIFKIMRLVC
jgi:hypothetical protein